MSNTATIKTSNPFQTQGWNYMESLGESSFSSLPHYYEDDMASEPPTPTFRSVSPKFYNRQRNEYFEEMREELEFGDDCDSLYEATLMKSNFLNNDLDSPQSSSSSLARLRQILEHLNPSYYNKMPSSPLASTLSSTPMTSVRSQFSASPLKPSQIQKRSPDVPIMKGFLIPDPRESKGKGKFNPTL
ncbi:unnamed protein product [Mucor hiemalis]